MAAAERERVEIHTRRYRVAREKQSQRERKPGNSPAAVVQNEREGDMNQSLSWCSLSLIFVLT